MKTKDIYNIYLKHPVICTDSRELTRGGIFFALKGENFNGNAYAESAVRDGCSYAVIDQPENKKNEQYILTENVLETLQDLARYHREQLNIPVIGITGTNGKTTTKELLGAILGKKYRIVSTKGNLNNHIGVPLTILSITGETEIAVVEMGANHPGEIAFLCDICRPGSGLVTNIGKAHLEGFGSFEGVVKTKKELYDFLTGNRKVVFANADNVILTGILKDYPFVSYGSGDANNCQGNIIRGTSFLEADINIKNIQGNYASGNFSSSFRVSSNLVGEYNLENLLAAVTVGSYFGVLPDQIAEAVRSYQPDNNRSQLKKTGKNTLILDAYNANPSSMSLAVKNYTTLAAEKKILILGDMLELGEYAVQEHAAIVQLVKLSGFSDVFFVGKVFSETAPAYGYKTFENTDMLCAFIKENPVENASILIKGSRGIKLEKVVDLL